MHKITFDIKKVIKIWNHYRQRGWRVPHKYGNHFELSFHEGVGGVSQTETVSDFNAFLVFQHNTRGNCPLDGDSGQGQRWGTKRVLSIKYWVLIEY